MPRPSGSSRRGRHGGIVDTGVVDSGVVDIGVVDIGVVDIRVVDSGTKPTPLIANL